MEQNINDKIQNIIQDSEVMLFMKGTPVMPQCGFSAAVVGVLSHMAIKFDSVNVLEDAEIREGIKEFSDWPTIPQLYVKSEFVGGCDIIREMHESGELSEYFTKAGIEA
jgi:monothiol glutaredoxin